MTISCDNLTGRMRQICEGLDEYNQPISMDLGTRVQYLKHFFPSSSHADLVEYVTKSRELASTSGMRGLGDLVARGIKVATLGAVKPCGGCQKRQDWLNKLVPFTALPSEVEHADIDISTPRHLLMHIWPTENGAWRWNLDQVMQREHIFTGKRTIAVATGPNTEPIEAVQEYLNQFDAEVIAVTNNPRIREGASLHKLLATVHGEEGITFYCHAKGARHSNFSYDTTVRRWTDAMYWLCLDRIHTVLPALQDHAMTGPFKRYGMFRTPRNHRWHYSGSFYWFRNADVFSRGWTQMDRQFFAVESWPGLLFAPSETHCLFMDHAGDLYKQNYWDSEVKVELKRIGYSQREKHAATSTASK